MANYCRIIPNSLWEELEQKGLFENAFPSQAPTKKQLLLAKFPQSLHNSVEDLLKKFGQDYDWNDNFELLYKYNLIPESNIVELYTNYILKSKKFEFLKGSEYFPKLQNIVNNLMFGVHDSLKGETQKPAKIKPLKFQTFEEWKTFENVGKKCKNGKVCKAALLKKANRVRGGVRIYKKQSAIQKSKKNTKRIA